MNRRFKIALTMLLASLVPLSITGSMTRPEARFLPRKTRRSAMSRKKF